MKHEIRRVVTTHDDSGRSVIREDALVPLQAIGPIHALRAWTIDQVPCDENNSDTQRAVPLDQATAENGVALNIVDFPPGAEFPPHRTASIDFGIVMQGQIDLVLDDDISATVGAGGLIIQRGTIHAWRNSSAEWARAAFVLTAAKPVVVGDKVIEADMH